MKVQFINNKNEWDGFVSKQEYSLFTQYSAYGDFYEAIGEQSWIVGIYDNEKLIGGSLIVSVRARRGNFLFMPYGPILDYANDKPLSELIKFVRKFAYEKRYDFIRICPFIDDTQRHKEIFTENGFHNAPIHMLAETTWLLDISKTEEKLLNGMKKNHRNLVRKCIREGVNIQKTNSKEALRRLNDMHDITANKHNFHRFSHNYVEKEFNVFSANDEALVFEAYLPDGALDASSIIIFEGNMPAYRHSASLNINTKLPSSYLIQWEAILESKRRNKKLYNFWGIAPNGSKKSHPFAGITHFKKGFGGFQKNLLHCQDLPIRKKYWITFIIETVRKIKRGF